MNLKRPAVYENGILRLQQPLPLANGAAVEVVVVTPGDPTEASPIAAALAEIAALPMEVDDGGFCGADHDQFLYGPRGTE